ncbi:MAG: DDRGK domain-containing 1-like [Trebouxia sp. A1-2]|nr:MAG: DDRGK domain-containing 1-like [Trebouxia sp. A1-2]
MAVEGAVPYIALIGFLALTAVPAGQEGQRARPVNRVHAGIRRRQRAAAAAQQQQQQEQEAAAEQESASEGEENAEQPRQQVPQIAKTARSAYEERRRKKDAERETAEAAEEAELARAAAARYAKQEAEAAEWMGQISVEEQGQEADDQQEGQGMLGAFVEFIKERKTVALEDLAAEFGLRVQDAIRRVQDLEKMGHLSGVMDDRGKYIYISRQEMEAVAEYIKKRGRIAIGELAAKSNTFIDLEAKATAVSCQTMPGLDLAEPLEAAA